MEVQPSVDRAWAVGLHRSEKGSPLVSPLFVFEYSQAMRLVDLRDPKEATGLLGHIEGSRFRTAGEVQADDDLDTPLILLSRSGKKARELARSMEKAGHRAVAAMNGGLVSWRRLGLDTSREAPGQAPNDTSCGHADLAAMPVVSTLGLENIREQIGQQGAVQWIQIAALAYHANTSCVDGRDDRRIIGAPGGDMGEFVLTLTALEQVTGIQLTRQQIQETLLTQIDTYGNFYMHSDVDALQKLRAELATDARFDGALPAGEDLLEWQSWLGNPPTHLQDALIEPLVDPENLGCGHLKLMQLHPEQYGVRPDLVQDALRSFARLLWDGAAELRYVVLHGGHREGAVVEVKLDEAPWTLSFIPVMSPSLCGHQVFLNHPDVAAFKHSSYVRFHQDTGPVKLPSGKAQEMEAALAKLAAQQLGATLAHLAKGLPVFELHFATDRSFEIKHSGTVG